MEAGGADERKMKSKQKGRKRKDGKRKWMNKEEIKW